MTDLLEGWAIGRASDTAWVDWGEHGDARAKVLSTGDGYLVTLVEAEAGYTGGPHEHANTEFLYVLDGSLTNQGEPMRAGDAYVANAGSSHSDFRVVTRSTYLIIFKL